MSKDKHSGPPVDPGPSGKHAHDDDAIVVPKGSSRARFLMTALLAILVLTTFTVSREVVDVFTGGNQARSAYMSWKRPDGSVETISQTDFLIVMQDLARAQSILSGGRSTRDRDDVSTARHIIVDELAKKAGVDVTDEELRQAILPRFGGSAETYRMILERHRTTAREFEATLRSLMRVDRFHSLLAASVATLDPDEVLDRWKETHKEFSIDIVEVETEAFAEAAAAACPSGEELQKWFEALPDPEKSTYRLPIEAKTAAEFAWFNLESPGKTERLLEKYPRPEGENPDDVARTWYEVHKAKLFKKTDLPPGQPPSPDDPRPFEEVQETARTEGLANQCILDWLNDMKTREASGEAVNFAVEAASMGLAYRREDSLHGQMEWRTIGMPWSGREPVDAMFAATSEAGKVLPDVIVDPKAILVGRLLQKQVSRTPEFAEIEPKVREGCITKKKGELALAKLEELYAKLPRVSNPDDPATPKVVEPDAEKFRAAAKELGLEVKTQDWFDAGATIKAAEASPLRLFLRQVAPRVAEATGTVSKPELATDKKHAWLARNAATRDPDPAKLTPFDYSTAEQYASFDARQKFYDDNFGSDEFLKKQYGLELEVWRRKEAEKPAPQ